MRKLKVLLFLIVLLAIVSFKITPDDNSEIEAILKVIEMEGNAHATHNLEGLREAYIHDRQTVRVHTRKKNYSILEGWDQVNSLFEGWMNMDMSKYKNIQHSKENVIIKVLDNSAWLICDNNWKFEVDGEQVEDSEVQITFLEKTSNDWKISFNAIVTKPGPKRE